MITIAVTREEGGEWIDWKPPTAQDWKSNPRTVHSIKFDNGAVWDAVNGWRRTPPTEAHNYDSDVSEVVVGRVQAEADKIMALEKFLTI